MRCRVAVALAVILTGLPVAAETVVIEASRDATLIEDPDGALANGAGPALFAGRTNQATNGTRRALVYFDVAAVVPRGAILESAVLQLFLNPSNPDPRTIRLYRVLADWGEGASSSAGGGGAPAGTGDVTWLHTFWDTEFWVHGGGQFLGRSTAEQVVADSGFFVWDGDEHMLQDVRLWVVAPRSNFGWILVGDETTRQTSKGFASREDPDPTRRPVLIVSYRLPGQN